MWYEGNTCNMHLDRLAAKVREGVAAAGMVGMRFNTIGVSDGISMGTEGMSYSLPSRDVIADSIETVMQAQWYDALVAIPGCDKNMPGCLIAMGRLNRPALMVYGGTIKPGHLADGTDPRHRLGLPVLRRVCGRHGSTTPAGPTSSAMPARAPAPAAGCTPPTRWPPPSRPWAWPCPTRPRFPPSIPTRRRSACGRGRPSCTCSRRTSSPATS